jgi:hypothetical protein
MPEIYVHCHVYKISGLKKKTNTISWWSWSSLFYAHVLLYVGPSLLVSVFKMSQSSIFQAGKQKLRLKKTYPSPLGLQTPSLVNQEKVAEFLQD